MWKGNLVVDAVAHAYDFVEENRKPDCPPELYKGLAKFVYDLGHGPMESREPGYLQTIEEFSAGWSAEELASVFFEESDVDLIVYHGVEISAFFNRGSSPWEIGVQMKKQWPDRVLLYAPVDPFKGESELEEMERKVAEAKVDGFKYYPSNGLIDHDRNRAVTILSSDPEKAFPFFEKARELGVRVQSIHKAWPVGPGPLDKDRLDDVNSAAIAFPDLIFEVVHSGWAFVEECGLQLMLHPNIWANLEGVANFVVRQPRRFGHVIGTLMRYGGDDRIMFGTGCALAHPQPILQAFGDFVMPDELAEGHGYGPLTDESKAKILGGNIARLHGLDVDATLARIADDEWARRRRALQEAGEVRPWRMLRERLAAVPA
ncbi:MAG: amidohydrolase family protein [Thermoleophilia bacterium]